MQFLTTGGGTVRFNPNLYADGKVCLSLLGTWEGPKWVPGVSTLSQVLLSIQSAILVDAPWANEPGDEAHLQTERGIRAVARHNLHLRLATVRHAVIEHIKRPPKCEFAASAPRAGAWAWSLPSPPPSHPLQAPPPLRRL